MYTGLGAITATSGQQLEIPCVDVTWRSELPPGAPGYSDKTYGCGGQGADPCKHTTPVCGSDYGTPHTFNAQQQMLRDLGFNAGAIGVSPRRLPAAWDAYSKSRGLPVPSRGGKLGEQHMRMLISDWAGKWGVAAKEGAMPTYTYVHAASGATVQAKNSIEAAQKFKNMGVQDAAVASTTGIIAKHKSPQQTGGGGTIAAAPQTGSGILAAAASLTGIAPRTLLWVAGGAGVLGLGYLVTRKRKAA